MKKIYIGNAFEPMQVIANDTKSIREIYSENGIDLPVNVVTTWNTRRMVNENLDRPIKDLGSLRDGDLIVFSQKLNGAK